MGLFSNKRGRREDVSEPVKLLVADHEKAERLFDEITAADSVAARQALVAQLDAELTRHTNIEERVLYPFVRDNVEGGRDLVVEAEQEHAEARTVLTRVATLDVSTGDFEQALKELEQVVGHHVDEEESTLFPKLEQSTGADRLARLRTELETAKLAESPSPQLPADGGRSRTGRATTTSRSGGRQASRSSSSGAKGAVWVQPHHTDDSRWQVRRELASRASRVFDTQAEAKDFGRNVARREKVEFIIAGRDGAIREKHSYGNDPTSVRG
jgi:iron-sulfur cluster repair protein YtfE (RIC family)